MKKFLFWMVTTYIVILLNACSTLKLNITSSATSISPMNCKKKRHSHNCDYAIS